MRLQLRKQQAEAGDIVLLYGDESEALTHPYLARAWAKSGADLRVPAPGQANKVAMLGSLDHLTRQLIVHTSPTKRSGDFIAHLEQLDRLYGPQPGRQAKPVVLVEDNGPIHTSKRSLTALAARARAALTSDAAEFVLPGVVKWVALSVRTVWTLQGTATIREVSRGAARRLLMQFGEGELRGSVDCDDEAEFALGGSDFSNVDMKIADRVSLEFSLGGGFAFALRQPRDPVPLQTPIKGRARQMRDGGCRA